MVVTPHLTRYASHDVTLLGDTRRPGGVTLAFTERTGGFSKKPYASLNLGDACGDDPQRWRPNRRLALEALGRGGWRSVWSTHCRCMADDVLVVSDGSDEGVRRAQAEAREGADAVVCAVADVPVLLCYADCVPVVLVAPGAFAVVHSGWRGTIARISAQGPRVLCAMTGRDARPRCSAYVGPHIGADDYEVSPSWPSASWTSSGVTWCSRERTSTSVWRVRQALVERGVAPRRSATSAPPRRRHGPVLLVSRRGRHVWRHGAIAVLACGAQEVRHGSRR